MREEADFDKSTDDRFFRYYLEQSESVETIGRLERLADLILKTLRRERPAQPELHCDIADIGGGAATLACVFARAGHRATCIDISTDLLEVGRQRAAAENLPVKFLNCSATSIPLPDHSMDACVVPELLEHVVDWRTVLDEATRLLRPGGFLYLSTTNWLSPRQDEFELPLYSWYPARLKRYCERLAKTTHPQLANYGKYPAVSWFTYYRLRDELAARGFDLFMDRLDMIEVRTHGTFKARVARALQRVPLARLACQFVTGNTLILARKRPDSAVS